MNLNERIVSLPLKNKQFSNRFISPKSVRSSLEKPDGNFHSKEIDKTRAKIFTPELEELVSKVSAKKKEIYDVAEKPIQIFEENETELNELYLGIYASKKRKASLVKYISHYLKPLKLHGFILSVNEKFTGLYKPILSSGISGTTAKNFYFHTTDHFLNEMDDNFFLLNFEESKSLDIYFEKKLSVVDFHSFTGVLLHKIIYKELNALIVIFYKLDEIDLKIELNKYKDKISNLVNGILPAISRLENEEFQNADHSNLYFDLIKYAKMRVLRGETKFLYISKIFISNYFKIENRIEYKKNWIQFLKSSLTDKEIIIETAHNEVFYISDDPPEKLESLLESSKSNFQFVLTHTHYPDDGKNLYLYI
ncbi:MAG: hypothetical protein SFU98_19570 [Leptospiraceae bacterium]|nr:hypothetical protein [Leptospiraceae bacterium]